MCQASPDSFYSQFLADDASNTDYRDLASELKILIHIGEHQNVVNLLGACTTGNVGKLCIILEYCRDGDVSTFLRSKRDVFEATWTTYESGLEYNCTHLDLANIAYQIARGMDFLSSKKASGDLSMVFRRSFSQVSCTL